MTILPRLRRSALLSLAVACGACRSFEIEEDQFAIISVPTTLTPEGYVTRPSAFFFEGSSVRLSTTTVGAEGCIVRDFRSGGADSFDYIEAGAALDVNLGSTVTSIPKSIGSGRISYDLPSGMSIPFTPGEVVTFAIPGAVGGFPTTRVSARTVTAFTPESVRLPASPTEDLTVTWTNPEAASSGSAMFYSFRYDAIGSSVIDKEVACVFADDGSGVVTGTLLEGFRNSQLQVIVAQRARITIERFGNALTHITSALSVPVELLGAN